MENKKGDNYINGATTLKSSSSSVVVREVDKFCYALGGKNPIHSILIANNGMAAVKFIRSIRAWTYETFGTEKAVFLLAMATPEDMNVNAEHIKIADQFVQVPGGTNNNNYANVQLIVEIAEIRGVDAVWPGWGHASENPELTNALNAKGIVFLGPSASSMAALGDKICSLLIAQATQVPTLPWSGSHVKLQQDSFIMSIPEDVYAKASVFTTEEAVSCCHSMGYPAMIKASWGGGGKGIRKVNNDEEVMALFKQVQGEVQGSPIFIMKVASQSRHLEVQLLCDQHGNIAVLHSRDCSIQRRHQKIIEEGPITVAPSETVQEMEQAARRLAKCVNYVGAATVEYLYTMDTGEYYFLELNPRLQVEHPVTEWICEINLPAAQVAIGMGIPLWQLPEIRRFYGMKHNGGYESWRKISLVSTPFDFNKAVSTKPKGHCVAVRVTSEDPDDGFKPTIGKVQELSFKSKPNVWAYFSIESGGGIHEFSDSQFGHIFAFGESRGLAITNMVLGLKEIRIRGKIRNNVDYTIDLLIASDYKENEIHTGWLDDRISTRVRAERPPWYLSVIGGAIYTASTRSIMLVSEYVGFLEKGQIPPKRIPLIKSQVSLNIEGRKYVISCTRGGPWSYRLKMNGSEIEAEIHNLNDGGLLIQVDGNSHVIHSEEEAVGTRLVIDGNNCLLENDDDPTKLVAETPCKLLRYLVTDGSNVRDGTAYVEVEVMKMCMPLISLASGTIHFKMSEGQVMQAGKLIAVLDLDSPFAVRKAETFHGRFPALGPPSVVSGKVNRIFAANLNAARMILAGYEHDIDEVVHNLLDCLDNTELPFLQWQEFFATLEYRLPKDLRHALNSCFVHDNVEFPAKRFQGIIKTHLSTCPDHEKGSEERLLEPLTNLLKSYEDGRESHACGVIQSLFEGYLNVEQLFSGNIQADVIEQLRLQYKKDLHKVVEIVLSHQGIQTKNKLILRLMEEHVSSNSAAYQDNLIHFSSLNGINYSELALKARKLLEQAKFCELRSNITRNLSELEFFSENGENVDTKRKGALNEKIEALVTAPFAVEDALISLFYHTDHMIRMPIIETYIRRLYQPYLVQDSIKMQQHRCGLIASWEFSKDVKSKNRSREHPTKNVLNEKFLDRKWGAMVVIKSFQLHTIVIAAALSEATSILQDKLPNATLSPAFHCNTMHIALIGISNSVCSLQNSGYDDQDQEIIKNLDKIFREEKLNSSLIKAGVGIISCIIQQDDTRGPIRRSFHWSSEKLYYVEEPLVCRLEPPFCKYLELEKLKCYDSINYTPSNEHQWHLYTVTEKTSSLRRMYLRTLVWKPVSCEGFTFHQELDNGISQSHCTPSATSTSISRYLVSAMEELKLHVHNPDTKPDLAHIYLCMMEEQHIDDLLHRDKGVGINTEFKEETVVKFMKDLAYEIYSTVGMKMYHLGVHEWEVKLLISTHGESNGAWRIVVTNLTGCTCIVHVYREVFLDNTEQKIVYHSISERGHLHRVPINASYPPLTVLDRKRIMARKSNTTYCYDFLMLFKTAVRKAWLSNNLGNERPKDGFLFKATEFIFGDASGNWGTPLVSMQREQGVNDVGMVAWTVEMSTPEFPSGRTIIVIANDVTFKNGSFGPREDSFFQAVADVSCSKKVPLIYLAANSGARIGVSEEVKSCFKVNWTDTSCPEVGFQYLYLTPKDNKRIGSSVKAYERKLSNGEIHWVIDTIVGEEYGIGMENLSGSAAIASAYSKAYKETFTITYVSGKTVGVGAYLARLGMRCIQRLDQPIILAGFSALNKLLGREVYSSHMQLGGPEIMSTNGVVHLTVSDDLEGISTILKWLSFVPAQSGGSLPILNPPLDSPERPVEYIPEDACDPRATIHGVVDSSGTWLGGIFDRDSFVETQQGWGKSVVTGRAKIGGIPIGLICTETRTVMQVIPADPVQLDSNQRVISQAGQIWFPDSATKTAQAMMDFNREELPLFILANWRGLSGGKKDLFEGILQAGANIIENLRTYSQPVFVYIPIKGELRGGAWAVIDTKINPNHVEMYADPTAKASILEPEGIIEIKFRIKDLHECMDRLDTQLISLKQKKMETEVRGDLATMDTIKQQIKTRRGQLLPMYTQIATNFAKLHDTSSNMVAKGLVKDVVEWKKSRYFFYKRLRRRLSEYSFIKKMRDVCGENLSHKSALGTMKKWFLDFESPSTRTAATWSWDDDESFFFWMDDYRNYENGLKELRNEKVVQQMMKISDSVLDLQALPQSLLALLKKAEPLTRKRVVGELQEVLNSFS